MSAPRRWILLLVIMTGCPLAAAAAEPEEADADVHDDAAAAAERGRAGEPLAVGEVFQLRMEGNVPRLYTSLPTTPIDEVGVLNVPALGESVELRHIGTGDLGGAAEPGRSGVPQVFKLEAVNNERLGERVGVVVSWHDGVLDVQRSVHYTGPKRYTRLTRLLATANPEFGSGPSVQLLVTESGDVGGKPLRVFARAKDFPGLLRRHRGDVEAHLRPMLRELGQEALFAPEPLVAWQVFADRWRPPEGLEQKVRALLPGLDADDAAAREAAGERVAALGREAALVLMRLDRAGLSAEQNTRIDTLIASHAPLSRAEVGRLREDVGFLLDCLNSDEAPVREAALALLRDAVPRPVEFDPAQPAPARAAAVAALRDELVPAE